MDTLIIVFCMRARRKRYISRCLRPATKQGRRIFFFYWQIMKQREERARSCSLVRFYTPRLIFNTKGQAENSRNKQWGKEANYISSRDGDYN